MKFPIIITFMLSTIVMAQELEQTESGIFDNITGTISAITDAVTGHVKDGVSRLQSGEKLTETRLVKHGKFHKDHVGSDTIHWADGNVGVVEKDGDYYIYLSNVDIGPAPNLWLYYSRTATGIQTIEQFHATAQIPVAQIPGRKYQYYKIPQQHARSVRSITIICKRFNVFISSTDMELADI